MIRNFDEVRERNDQLGSEWQYGAIQTDLAMVPLEKRVTYLPAGVKQFNQFFDTNGCASRGPLNILETKLDYFYDHGMHPAVQQWCDKNGYRVNGKFALADAYIEILSGSTQSGNSMKAPVSAIENFGVVPANKMAPLETFKTWGDYMNPKRVTKDLKELGGEFLRRVTFHYEQVPLSRFKEAMRDDLLEVALHAWPTPINGVYPKNDGQLNHVVEVFAPAIDIFDNYEPFSKRLATDYTFFEWGYSFSITAQNPYPDETITLFETLKQFGLLAFFNKALDLLLDRAVPVPPVTTQPHMSRISAWALAIQRQEGGKPQDINTRLHNPGNLKFSPYTASLGGKKSTVPGLDGGTFCMFDTYAEGFRALCQFLTDGANDLLASYHNARTLRQFTKVYANPPSDSYAINVAKDLDVSPDINIRELL